MDGISPSCASLFTDKQLLYHALYMRRFTTWSINVSMKTMSANLINPLSLYDICHPWEISNHWILIYVQALFLSDWQMSVINILRYPVIPYIPWYTQTLVELYFILGISSFLVGNGWKYTYTHSMHDFGMDFSKPFYHCTQSLQWIIFLMNW